MITSIVFIVMAIVCTGIIIIFHANGHFRVSPFGDKLGYTARRVQLDIIDSRLRTAAAKGQTQIKAFSGDKPTTDFITKYYTNRKFIVEAEGDDDYLIITISF